MNTQYEFLVYRGHSMKWVCNPIAGDEVVQYRARAVTPWETKACTNTSIPEYVLNDVRVYLGMDCNWHTMGTGGRDPNA